jgi:hypothetical protein
MPGASKRLRNRDPGSFEREGGFYATASRFRSLLKALVIMRTCGGPVYQALKDTLNDPAKVSTLARVKGCQSIPGILHHKHDDVREGVQ